MLEILIIAAVITAKLFSVDRQYAKRGQVPPGYRLIEKWLDGRKARGQAPADAQPARYGMWRYFWQRWQAAWEGASQTHAIRHQALLNERAEAAARGELPPRRPSLKEQTKAAWQWVIDTIVSPVGPTEQEPAADTKAAAEPDGNADGPRIACDTCGATLIDSSGGWEHPPGADCTNATAAAESTSTQETAKPSDHDTPPSQPNEPPTQPDATPNNEGAPMTATTQQSGEVVGLTSAINYANAVAAAHAAHSLGGGESYMASLAQAEVGPETIQSAAAAQEASAIAAGAWETHASKLSEQLAAKEAVTSETGKKEFLLAD